MMQKILLTCLIGVGFVQNTFSATAIIGSPNSDELHRRFSSDSVFPSFKGYTPGGRKRSLIESDKTPQPERSIPPAESTPNLSRITFEFSTAQKDELRRCGISDSQIDKIEALQTILFRSPCGDPLKPRSFLSKAELNAICKKLDSQEFNELVFTLKSLYEQKIPKSRSGDNTVFTPAARLSCTDPNGPKAKEITNILKTSCKGLRVEHVTGLTFIEEETPETPEERTARHKLKEELFKALEAKRGLTDESRNLELNEIERLWSNYFEFMRLRVDAIDNGDSSKIRPSEIEEIFKELVGFKYSSKIVDDCVVYFRNEDIDLDRSNIENITNKQLLSQGLAPIGADGEPMELHHLTRRHPGILVLMTQRFHQQHNALLHLRSEKHMRQPQPVDRAISSSWKKTALGVAIFNAVVAETEEFDPAIKLFSETDLQPQDAETT